MHYFDITMNVRVGLLAFIILVLNTCGETHDKHFNTWFTHCSPRCLVKTCMKKEPVLPLVSDVCLDVRTVWNQLVGVGVVAEKLRPPEWWPLVRGKIRFSTSGGSVKWWVAGILGAIWNDLKADVLPTEFGKSKAWQMRSCWWHLSQNRTMS